MQTYDKCLVKNRVHERCGGDIETWTRVEVRLGRYEHGDPIRCRKCGWEGEIFVDDGGVDFVWHPPAQESE